MIKTLTPNPRDWKKSNQYCNNIIIITNTLLWFTLYHYSTPSSNQWKKGKKTRPKKLAVAVSVKTSILFHTSFSFSSLTECLADAMNKRGLHIKGVKMSFSFDQDYSSNTNYPFCLPSVSWLLIQVVLESRGFNPFTENFTQGVRGRASPKPVERIKYKGQGAGRGQEAPIYSQQKIYSYLYNSL